MKEQCQCYNVIHPDNPHKCTLCDRNFSACLYVNELQHKITLQAIEIDQLKNDLKTSENEVRRQRSDLETLSMKYTAGLDRMVNIQKQKELADRELEELSARLFEEANNMVAIERRKKHQLEELLQHTQEQLNTEQSQLNELRNRIEATVALSSKDSFSLYLQNNIEGPMAAAQIMRLHNESRVDRQPRHTGSTIEYSSNTRKLLKEFKAQNSPLSFCKSKLNAIDMENFAQYDKISEAESINEYGEMVHPSDSAYFSSSDSLIKPEKPTISDIQECNISFSISGGVQYTSFQNFIEQQQKYRNNSIPSLITDMSSSCSSRRGSADQEDDQFYSIFQHNSSSTITKTQPSSDFVTRVEIEDIVPCLQFGSLNSRMCLKTVMEHLKHAPCFIEHIDLEEARNLPSPTNAISSAYYRPFWERLTISSTPSPHLECSACGNKCVITTTVAKHSKSYFRFRLTEKEDWLLIDQNCRDRLVAVCEFYSFVRNIQLGYYKQRPLHDLYLENVKLRLNIFYSRS